jgi:hypothetical protein
MNVGEIVATAIRQAKRYGIELNRIEIIEVLNNQLSTIHFDLGFPLSIWESTSSKASTIDIIDYPDDCIDLQRLFIDGAEAYKLPIDEFERQYKSE